MKASIIPGSRMSASPIAPLSFFLAVLFTLLLSSCGGGGGATTPPPSVLLSGLVQAPAGQVALQRNTTLLDSMASLLIPASHATVSGLLLVADDTQVDLVRITDVGMVDTVIASTTTTDGRYAFDLTALDIDFSSDLMVLVSGFGVEMRAFVSADTININPLSEAVSRLILEKIAATSGLLLINVTTTEIKDIDASCDLLTSLHGLTTLADIDSTVTVILDLLRQDSDITNFLTIAASPGQTDVGPGDVGNLLPLAQDDIWHYLEEASDQSRPYFNTMTVTGTKLIAGLTASIVTESNPNNSGIPTEEYLEKNSYGVFNQGNNDPDDFLTPQLVPFQQARFPTIIGASNEVINQSGLVWQQDIDGDSINESFNASATVTHTGMEAVTLPMGDFPITLRTDIKLDVTVTLSAAGEKISVVNNITEWQAPGIGLIKTNESILTEGLGTSITDTNTKELRGYRVSGHGRGLLPAFTIAENLATANSDTQTPGQTGIGFDGNNYLVVTCREAGSDSPSGIIGVFVSTTGTLSTPFSIAQHTCFGFSAVVAFDGTNYLLVTMSYSDGNSGSPQMNAHRITPAGNVLDSFPITTGTESVFSPALAYDGTNYLLVYGKYMLNTTLWDIYASRISPAGQVINEFPIAAASGDQLSPSVAFDGTNYMVVWEDNPAGSSPTDTADVIAARISPAGTILDAAGIAIATAAGYQGDPHVTFDGNNYFIVWADVESFFMSPPISSIYGRRLTPDGILLDGSADTNGIAINTSSLSKGDITVNFNGSNYFVVWRMGTFSNDPPAGVFASRITTAGEKLDGAPDSTGLSVSGVPVDFSRYVHPSLLFNGTNTLLTWNNNIELAGSKKSLEALFIYPF